MSNLIKASFWLSISELVFNISGYIIHALMGRILDPAGYGQFSIIITFTTMMVILVGRGIPISTSKYLGEVITDRENNYYKIKKSAFFVQIMVILFVTIIYFFLAPVFAILLRDPSLTNLFRISSLIIPAFALASFYTYYFTGIKAFKIQSFLKIWRSVLKVFLIVGLGFLYKVKGAIVGQALAPFVVFLTGYFIDPFSKSKLKNKKSFKESPIDFKLSKKLSKFAGPIVVFMLFYEFMLSMNLYFVKALMGSDELTGIYSAASTVSRIPYYLFFFMTIILLPKISELIANKKKEQTQKLLSNAFKYLFLILVPTTLLLSLFSESAIRFFYGSRYTSAGSIMSILIFGFSFLTIFYIITFVLNGSGKNRFPVATAITGTLLNGVLNWILIKKMGLLGSAWATTITAFIIMLWALIYANFKIVKFINIKAISKYLLASVLVYLIGFFVFGQGRFIFILWIIVLMSIYFAIMWLLKEIGHKDLDYLINSFKK
jgi:O-antigen/teichoic acid export membrane protein